MKLRLKSAIVLVFLMIGIQQISAQVPFTEVPNSTLRINGELKIIGNAIVGLNQSGFTPNDNYNGNASNNQKFFGYIDIDGDTSTFSSSSAELQLTSGCERIAYAGLYWSASYFTQMNPADTRFVQYTGLPFPDNRPDFRTIKIRPPGGGGYVTIPPTQTQVIYDGYRNTATNPSNSAVIDIPYVCYADVTTLIQGLGAGNANGTYTVADMRASTGFSGFNANGIAGGWVLVVAYEDPTLSAKYISTNNGYLVIAPGNPLQTFSYTGFQTLPAPLPVRARYSIATLEGDRPFAGDIFQVQRPDTAWQNIFTTPANPNNNFYDSSISIDGQYVTTANPLTPDRTPSSINTLGFDADIFDIPNPGRTVIGNDQTSASFRTTSAGDAYSVFFNSFQIEIIEPELTVTKRVLDINGVDITGDPVNFADQLFYELTIENQGNEDITAASIRDVLPDNVDFTLGTITTSNPGIVATPNGTNRQIDITIADPLIVRNGGVHTVRFGVSVVATCADLRDACSNQINNVAISTYTGVESGITRTGEESILEQDACQFDITGTSNVLINDGVCFTTAQPAFICTGSLTLTAGAGFSSYEWVNASSPGVVIGTNRDLVVTTAGTYIVTETGAPGCQDAQQTFNVDAFNTVVNPVVDIANNLGSNPNVNGNVRTCPITGDPLPEIFLCGAGTTLTIPTPGNTLGFPVGTTVQWQRLDPMDCPAVPRDPNCPTTDSGCDGDWQTLSTDINSFTISQAGEYRVNATFDGNCTIPFYFNVFQNNFDPDLAVIRQIICGTPGTIRVQNSSLQYEYQLITPITNTVIGYQASAEFTGLTEVGTYTVNVRQVGGLPTACVFQETIFLDELDATETVTPTSPTCPGDQGQIEITVTDSQINYTYIINSTTTAFNDTEGPTTVPNHTFTGLNPDTYNVQVLSADGSCSEPFTITINDPAAFSATIRLVEDLHCNPNYQPDISLPDYDNDLFIAIYEVTVTGGSGNFAFNNQADFLGTALAPLTGTTYQFRATAAGNYPVFVNDLDNSCTIAAGSVDVSPYTAITATATPIDPVCPTDNGSIQVAVTAGSGSPFTYVLDQGTATEVTIGPTVNTSETFNNVDPLTTHTVIVQDGFGCDFEITNITFTAPTVITANIAVTDYRCDASGSSTTPQLAQITISGASGGNGSYEYSIDGVDFSNTTGIFTGLTDGTYTIYIRDTSTAACPVNLGQRTIDPLQEVTDLTFAQTQPQCPALTSDITVSATGTNGAVSFEYRITAPPASVTAFSATTVYTLPAGDTYTFEARTTTDGCIYSENYTIDAVDPIAVTANITAEPTCATDTDASISFDVTGIDLTSTTYSYVVTGGTIVGSITGGPINTTPTSVPNLGAGTYTIVVTDDTTNCSATLTPPITITDPAVLSFTTTVVDSNCGVTSGIITVNASGGRGGYQYELRNSGGGVITAYQNGDTFSGLAAANYIVAVRDGNTAAACEVTNPVTVDQLTPPTIATAVGGDACYDTTNQATQWITITPSIPVPLGPFTYSLDGGAPVAVVFLPGPAPANTFEIPNLTPGTHSVTVSNTASNCTSTALSFDINPELTITANLDKDLDCSATPDATISFTATGGDGTYTFDVIEVGPGTVFLAGVTSPVSINAANTYEIRVTDGLGCIATSSQIIVNPTVVPTATTTVTDIVCNGDSSGVVVINPTAGVGPFEARITSPVAGAFTTNLTFTGLAAGTYDFEIRDAKQCLGTVQAIVTEPTLITVTNIAVTDYRCDASGSSTTPQLAQITISGASGGNGSYEYSIDGVDFSNTTGIFTGLTDGTYTIYIRDTSTAACPVNLGQRTIDPLQEVTDLTFAQTQPQCPALTSDITVSATGTNGAVSFEYRITAPPASVTAFSATTVYTLPAGDTYTFEARTTTDGCIYSENYTIDAVDPIAVTANITAEPTCATDTDASISFDVTGIDLTSTTYSYVVTGGTIPIATPITGNSITTTPTSVPNLGAGTYTIVVTDDTTNCSATLTPPITITDPAVLSFTTTVVDSNCGVTSGIITVNASGGRGGYQYELRNSGGVVITAYQNGDTFSGLAAANYIVAVRDGNTAAACEVTNPVTVDQLTPPTIATAVGGDACYDTTNQATQWITITPSIPVPLGPFTYSLDGGAPVAVVFLPGPAPANTFEIPNLTPGTHSVTVSNTASNCTSTALSFDINPELTITANLDKDLDCSATPDATISFTATGGDGTYTFDVIEVGPGTVFLAGVTSPVSINAANTYEIRVTDGLGCIATSSQIIVNPTVVPTATTTVTDVLCNGDSSGVVVINPTAGVGPFEARITSPVAGAFTTNLTFTGLAAGTYDFEIRDAKQCLGTVQAIVTESPQITATVDSITDIDCSTTTTGTIVLNPATGGSVGVTDYTYVLLDRVESPPLSGTFIITQNTRTTTNPVNLATGVGPTFDNLDAGTYLVDIIASDGCSNRVGPFVVTQPPFDLDFDVTPAPADCSTGARYQIEVSGGEGPYLINEFRATGSAIPPYEPLNGMLNGVLTPLPNGFGNETRHEFTGLDYGVPYVFEIIDTSSGCKYFETVTPVDPPGFDIAITNNDPVDCFGGANGFIEFTVTTPAGATTVDWEVFNADTGVTTGISGTLTAPLLSGTASGLSEGNYFIRAIETGGAPIPCTDAAPFTITQPSSLLTLNFLSATTADCNTPLSTVTMDANGGVPGYSFAAVPGSAPQPDPGVYPLTEVFTLNPATTTWVIFVQDANNCVVSREITIPPVTLAPVINTIDPFVDDACNFDNDYTFTVTATSNVPIPPGTGTLTFSIDGGAQVPGTVTGANTASHDFAVSGPGTYSVVVFDENGCPSPPRTITVYPELLVTATLTEPTCRDNDATIVATVSGGSDITANPGNFTFDLVNAGTGITVPGVTQTPGPGADQVTFSSTVAGTDGIFPGDYRVEVVDSAIGPVPGCEATFDITVPTFLDPIPSGVSTPVSCFNGTDGTILVSLDPTRDDNPPYQYQIVAGPLTRPLQPNPLFENLEAGTYDIVVVSDKGCSNTPAIQVTVGGPTAALTVTPDPPSAYGCNASNADVFPVITITIEGGTAPYDVSYSGAATGSETDVADADGVRAGVQYEVTAIVAGTYTFTVTDENNCAFANFDVIVPAFPIMTDPTITRDTAAVNNGVISCDNPETVTVSITGGTGPFDFVEVGGTLSSLGVGPGTDDNPGTVAVEANATNVTFALPSVGSYVFTITDQGTGCSIDTPAYVIDPFDTITATLTTVTDVLCNGALTGALELNIGGYTGAYNYTVVNAVSGANVPGYVNIAADVVTRNPEPITGLPAGTFEVSVEALDAPFCDEVSNTATIDQPAPLTLNFLSATIADCNTALSTVTMDANGGVPGYSFAAVPGSAPQPDPGVYPLTEVFTLNPATTTWVIFVQDANNCVVSREITIPPVTLAPVINTIDPFVDDACNFDNDYTFTVTATSNVPIPPGTGTLTFSIDGGAQVPGTVTGANTASHDFAVSGPGTYSVVVFDENGCPSPPRTITVYPELLVTATLTEPTCRDNDATIVATVSGGSDITANPGNFTFDLVNAGTGITVPGVTQTPGPGADQVTFSSTVAGTDGIFPGDYRVEVVDSAIGPVPGCEATFDITVPTFLDPIPSGVSTPVSCFNGTDGTILVSLDPTRDDNPPYQYQIVAGPLTRPLQPNPLFENLEAGTYDIVVVSDKGCSNTPAIQVTVGGPTAALTVTPDPPSAYGCNASNADVFPVITITIEGGTAPYDVSYSGAATGSETDVADADGVRAGVQYEVTAIVAGTYTFTVTDENNCAFANFDVIVPAFPIMTDPTITRDTAAVNNGVISCDNPETVTVSITGGTGPFDFVEVGGTLSSLGVGPGTDDNPGTVAVEANATNVTFALPSVGSYVFTITDQGTGCSIDTPAYVIDPFDTITATLTTVTDVLCNGALTGALELNIGGYTGAYNYTVVNAVSGANVPGYVNIAADVVTRNPEPITGLPAGTFEVSVEALGAPFCDEVSNRVNIASPPAITVTLDQKQDETCNPGDDASIEVVANGGTPPFRYQLESEDSGGVISIRVPFQTTTTIFTGLDANNATTNVLYRVRVLDANDCPSDETIVINPPVPLGLNAIAPTLLACSDSEDGTITATAFGGQGPGTYFFMLTFPDGSQSGAIASTTDTFQWIDLKPGNYIVTVTDNLACEIIQDPVVINAPPAVTIDVVQGPISCRGASPNPITVTAGGGTPGGYEFSSDGTTFVAGNLTPTTHEFTLLAGDYNFYVRDINGCVSPASNTIPVRDPVPLTAILDLSNTSIVCFGEPTGSIDASVTGGIGNYRYRVEGTDYLGNPVFLPGPGPTDTQDTSFFGDLLASTGNYEYIVTSTAIPVNPLTSCDEVREPFQISQPAEFIAEAFATPISCNGETDGTIRVTAVGGTAQYYFSLYNSAGNAVFTFIEDESENPDNEHTFTDLPADTYRVEVEDDNGCPRTILDIQIIEPAPILATVNATTPEDCAGDMNGTATLSITGGLPPANPADPSYFWSIDGVTYQAVTDPANLFIDNLPGGTTTVFIRDSQNNANCQGAFNIDIEPGVNLAGELVPELVCPIFDYSDPTSPVMTSEEQYFVSFDIVEESQGLGIIYTLNGINGTPNPPNNSNLTGNFEVTPGEYEGIMEYQGCTRTVDTIEILEYTPLAIPVAQMTNNPEDPNEYQIIASGGRPFENTPFYAFSFTMLEEGMTLDQLEPSDYTELDGNIFVIRQTADYVLRVVDADGCEVLTVQNLTYINIRIPNYFTPDSPNSTAEDRFWYPRQITPNIDDPFFFENMEVIVFDRYGRMLAEFKGDQQGWDGLYQGKQLPSGDYWYSIILNDVDNREFTGHFTLYR
ncbi:T9SS type B sorting domain-containing protein [Aquimarina spinulae]|uniref:T9SS type B sorting domain-containing protein n=6 Tax=Aquimarina spinulae TaxID=1192023 RepID=UPI0020C203B7|nr:T9SS type B sorting domain-containing protein [Aquimarina spinulae]